MINATEQPQSKLGAAPKKAITQHCINPINHRIQSQVIKWSRQQNTAKQMVSDLSSDSAMG